MKFQKKPVVIEAFHFTKESMLLGHFAWPKWLQQAWDKGIREPGRFYKNNLDWYLIWTLEGSQRVRFGNWIIKGVKGELYSCDPEIFALTYEAVEA